jgi:Fe-S-cluster containining protein
VNLERRKDILRKIYHIYDGFIKDYDLACKKSCSGCCTRNVTMTSLEAYGILDYLQENNRLDLIDRLKAEKDKQRFQPKVTINRLAEIYANEEPVPVEGKSDPFWGSCPILENDTCPIYEVRPFECRSMCSKEDCEEDGFADMDPFVLSVNNLFKQYIEHIDTFGVSGNLTDLIIYLEENTNKEILRGSEESIHPRLVNNHPAKILTVPAEHQEKIRSLYEQLQRISLE